MLYQPLPQLQPQRQRRGVAAVELAILLPVLMFFFLITIDYYRVFYFAVIVTNCARNGAMFASDPNTVALTGGPFTTVEQAALADAKDLSPAPTITKTYGAGYVAGYVEVTAAYSFQTISKYPGIPTTVDLRRTVRMQLAPATPNY